MKSERKLPETTTFTDEPSVTVRKTVNVSEDVVIDDTAKAIVIKALNNKDWHWRTMDGIVEETHLTKELVSNILQSLMSSGVAVRTVNPKNNELLYTTLKHYKETHNILDFSLSAFTGYIHY